MAIFKIAQYLNLSFYYSLDHALRWGLQYLKIYQGENTLSRKHWSKEDGAQREAAGMIRG